jgi:hypothetical protein
VIGFIHSEDILKLIRGGADLSSVTLDSILKPAHYVPPTKKVDEMFDYFQAHNTRVAIILGEYGEVSGIVTMKDVLTFIFGEISGKMAGQEYYLEDDENSYVVPGDMRLADFNNLTNFDIEDGVMATIGGVAFRLFDRLPEPGDSISHEGYRFVVKQRSGLRISQLLVQKRTSSEQADDGEEGADEFAADVDQRDSGSTAETADAPQPSEETPPKTRETKVSDDSVQPAEAPAKKKQELDHTKQPKKALSKVKTGKAPDESQPKGEK